MALLGHDPAQQRRSCDTVDSIESNLLHISPFGWLWTRRDLMSTLWDLPSGARGAIMGTGGGDYNACADHHRTLEYLSSSSSSLIELVCNRGKIGMTTNRSAEPLVAKSTRTLWRQTRRVEWRHLHCRWIKFRTQATLSSADLKDERIRCRKIMRILIVNFLCIYSDSIESMSVPILMRLSVGE